jgi:hypothetical protein
MPDCDIQSNILTMNLFQMIDMLSAARVDYVVVGGLAWRYTAINA